MLIPATFDEIRTNWGETSFQVWSGCTPEIDEIEPSDLGVYDVGMCTAGVDHY